MVFKIRQRMKMVNHEAWEDGLPKLGAQSVDLLLTDPPYGMSYQSNMRKDKHLKIENDDNLDWLPVWLKDVRRVLRSDAHCYIFCSWHKVDVFKRELELHDFGLKNILIWNKGGGGMGDLEGDYSPSYEMVLFCSLGKRKLNGKRDSNILPTGKTLNNYHPTEKPVSLLAYLIEKSTQKDDLVLDCFAGSFSTGVAAQETGRRFIGYEIEEKYCKIGDRRLDGVTPRLFGIDDF